MDAPDLDALAFPKLDPAQIEDIGMCTCTTRRHFDAGEVLFRVGDRDMDLYIIVSGAIDIVDTSGDAPRRVRLHEAGEFTGDVSHLTGLPSIITAVALTDTDVYAVPHNAVRDLLNVSPELSDIILKAFIARRQILRESGTFTGSRVIGSRYSQDTFRITDFLAANRMLYTWLDLERDSDAEVKMLLERLGLQAQDTPVVLTSARLLRNPSNRELADALGIRRPLEQRTYDFAVVGAGPAGLAAAVYAASEGLATVVLEGAAPGGQAGRSMRIENYLGFPTGITGADLIDRATLQANKFGAALSVPSSVLSLVFDNGYAVLSVDGGETISARCLLIASGAEYLRLSADGCSRFEGSGVYYAVTANEERLCSGQDVVVVGGGNSAGQAAVYLSGHARTVRMVVRGDSLARAMSSYLEHRIEMTPNIEVLLQTEVVRMNGEGSHLRSIEIRGRRTGEVRTLETPAVFSFIGAVPRTEWMLGQLDTDDRGFIRTGSAVAWRTEPRTRREPFLLETSRPGVFAAGDVRAGSVKRVASAVGEGAMSVQFVHEYMKGI
jgi:thioredoxin reductase (NADPH)